MQYVLSSFHNISPSFELQTILCDVMLLSGCQCVVIESNGGSEGHFQSTDYPKPYPALVSCVLYTFVGDLGEIVELSFSRFDLHAPRSSSAK